MHILLIHQAFVTVDEPGGTRHHELARLLVQRGHRVTIIASPISYLTGRVTGNDTNRSDYSNEPGITILRAYTYSALHRSFVHRVISFVSFMLSSFWAGVRVRDVDLIWGTSPPIFQAFTAWLLARLKRKPFLLEVRDLWPAFAIDVGVLKNPVLIRLSLWLERFLYQHADRIVVNSPGFIDHISNRGGKDIELVPNGVDPTMFDPTASGSDFRQAYAFDDRFVAMYAGAHGMSNDLEVVLEAARLLLDRPEVLIVFVGDGKEKPALLENARQMGLRNVIFLPPVPKGEMSAALAAADVCIAILKPIRMYLTVYPNKVFDYMAAGKPVLLAIDGVIRKVVEEARAGVFVPSGDPAALAQGIIALAKDPVQTKAMGLRGRKFVEQNFNRAELADQLAAIIESLS